MIEWRRRQQREKNSLIGCCCRIGFSEGPLKNCYQRFGNLLRILISICSLVFGLYLVVQLAGHGWNDCLGLYTIVLTSAVLALACFIWIFFVYLECGGGLHWGRVWIFACSDEGYYEDRMKTFKKVYTVCFNLSRWATVIWALTKFIIASSRRDNQDQDPKEYLCNAFWRETTVYVLLNLFELLCSLTVEFTHVVVGCGGFCGLQRRKRRQLGVKLENQEADQSNLSVSLLSDSN